MRHTFIAFFAMLFVCLTVPGCEHFQRLTGSPTQADVDAAQTAIEAAEKAVEESEAKRDALAREVEQIRKHAATTEAQRATLSAIQSRLALELANAPEEARPFLENQLDDIRRQSRSLDDRRAAWASQIAAFDSDLAAVDAVVRANTAALAKADGTIEEMRAAAEAANDRAAGMLSQVGSTIGTFVPGAAPILETVGPLLLGGLAAAGPVFGVAASRARKRAAKAEAERDGARKVIAVTEKHGLEAIATDPIAKQKARIEVSSDPVAARELALAAAQGKAMRV